MGESFYAHSGDGCGRGTGASDPEPLDKHLAEVAALAERFADAFGAGAWGRAVGYLHDAGKYRRSFQRYLNKQGPSPNHASAGAALAVERYGVLFGTLLGMVSSAHHAGLPDGLEEASFEHRLKDGAAVLLDDLDAAARALPLPSNPPPLPPCGLHPKDGFGTAFFLRMLFSALCDADFLATEAFCNPAQARARAEERNTTSLGALSAALDGHLAGLAAKTTAEPSLAAARREILDACRAAAGDPPGVFSLTVPTGGGKTLSSLSFALRHAIEHGLRRVVYVIPYTSIIEQTADVFRAALGPELKNAVLEHHSAAPIPKGDEPIGPHRLRLTQENWDAPIIVTTAVQFFESLYADRPSRCRKLHNLAKAVVVLDEVQSLPLARLTPCVAALERLRRDCGTTLLLCTATQPDLSAGVLGATLPSPREIIADRSALYARLTRVKTEQAGKLSDAELVARLREEPQALCIVDNRAHAAALYAALAGDEDAPEDLWHLSATLCPADRRRILATVRQRLNDGLPVTLVSTQVVEAGVDIDFPVVYRAMTGIDSLAQAAGRCNREGKRTDGGRFVVFDHDRKLWLPDLEKRRSLGRPFVEDGGDPLDPGRVMRYFAALHTVSDTDAKQVLTCFKAPAVKAETWEFREAARNMRLIDEDTVPVIVPVEGAAALCERLTAAARGGFPPALRDLRALQQVSVSVYRTMFTELDKWGAVGRLGPGGAFNRLVDDSLYHRRLGLMRPESEKRFEDNIL